MRFGLPLSLVLLVLSSLAIVGARGMAWATLAGRATGPTSALSPIRIAREDDDTIRIRLFAPHGANAAAVTDLPFTGLNSAAQSGRGLPKDALDDIAQSFGSDSPRAVALSSAPLLLAVAGTAVYATRAGSELCYAATADDQLSMVACHATALAGIIVGLRPGPENRGATVVGVAADSVRSLNIVLKSGMRVHAAIANNGFVAAVQDPYSPADIVGLEVTNADGQTHRVDI